MLGDPIYGTRDNWRRLKKLGIRFSGKPLGRPRRVTEANRADTSSAWINSIFLVINLLILLKIFFVPWLKAVRQPLSRIWTSAWALLRYRFAGLCFRMPGVARDENVVLTWAPGF